MKLNDTFINNLNKALQERMESLKEDDSVSTSEFRITLDLYSAVLDYKNPANLAEIRSLLEKDSIVIKSSNILKDRPLEGYTLLGLTLQEHEDFQGGYLQRFKVARDMISMGADPVRQYGSLLDSPAMGFGRLLPSFDGTQKSELSNDIIDFFNLFSAKKDSLLLVNNEGNNLGHILAEKLLNLSSFMQKRILQFEEEQLSGVRNDVEISKDREAFFKSAVNYTGYLLKLIKRMKDAGLDTSIENAKNISANDMLSLFRKEMPDVVEKVGVLETYNRFKFQERMLSITNALREVGAFDDKNVVSQFDTDRKTLEHWWGNNNYDNYKDFRADVITSFLLPLTRLHSILENNFMLLGIAKKINKHIQSTISALPEMFSDREKIIIKFADTIDIERPPIFDYVSKNLSLTKELDSELKSFSERKVDFHIQTKDSFTNFYDSLNELHISISSFKIFCDYVEMTNSEEKVRLLTPVEQQTSSLDRRAAPTYQKYISNMKNSLVKFQDSLEHLKTSVFDHQGDICKDGLAEGDNFKALVRLFDHSEALIDKVEQTISLGRIKSLPNLR